MTDDYDPPLDRRQVLTGVASAGAASMAGCSLFERGEDGDTSGVEDNRARGFAEQFAPTVYFDENEQWFPTDPRPYESERDGETIVDGFDALNGYVERGGAADPPDPIAFYNVREYEESPLAVVQYWFYSVFDQFTTNFHWHDWELLQVFFDTETEEPQLYVASSHSRSVPNNEFLDPDGTRRPRILSELGSHSSGLSVNEDADSFQRFPVDDSVADITNSVIEGIEAIAAIPLAYGLPRDEGIPLPYAVPELDGTPLYEHERLPSVDASDLVPEELTIRSFDAITSPPELPQRGTGERFEYRGADADGADVTYDLRPSTELEHITEFTGPQLSFEFSIPQFAEDVFADHITTTGVPWLGGRYENPASDISEATHRQALSDRYDAIGDPSPFNQVVAGVTNAVTSEDAPDGEGLITVSSPLEMFALFQSEPQAVPTFHGIAVVQDVPEGEHSLTINGAGVAPHHETVTVGEGVTAAGVEGEIPVVAREHAMKMEVDPREADSDLTNLAVEDDFAGRLYDAPLSGPDAVYVHRGGAFTTEVRDSDDELGAYRVNPDEEERVRIEEPNTGKTPLARYVADVAEETRAQVAAAGDDGTEPGEGGGSENAVKGLATALGAVAEAAERAADRAASGDRSNADQNLDTVTTRLERVATRLAEAREDLPAEVARATEQRLQQADRRSEQARGAQKL
jgi:hypothetical protein